MNDSEREAVEAAAKAAWTNGGNFDWGELTENQQTSVVGDMAVGIAAYTRLLGRRQHRFVLVADDDPSETEVCVNCGAQCNKDGPIAERASISDGWAKRDCAEPDGERVARELLNAVAAPAGRLSLTEPPPTPAEVERDADLIVRACRSARDSLDGTRSEREAVDG